MLDILVKRDGRSVLCVRHSDRERSVLKSDSQREREREKDQWCVFDCLVKRAGQWCVR